MKKILLAMCGMLILASCCNNKDEQSCNESTAATERVAVATAEQQAAAMIYDLANTEEQIISNFKEGEGEIGLRMIDNGTARFMKVRLTPHSSVGFHSHPTSCETVFVVQGTAKVIFESDTCIIQSGDCHNCPCGHGHSIINDSDEEVITLSVVNELGE